MNAREFFCSVRGAAQELADAPLTAERMEQEAVLKSRRDGPRGKGGATDPSRRIDALIDYEARARSERAGLRRVVARGKSVLHGLSRLDPVGAGVLRCRYVLCLPWPEVCERCGLELDAARARESMAFDRVDAEGVAALAEWRPSATVAER